MVRGKNTSPQGYSPPQWLEIDSVKLKLIRPASLGKGVKIGPEGQEPHVGCLARLEERLG